MDLNIILPKDWNPSLDGYFAWREKHKLGHADLKLTETLIQKFEK